MTEGFLDKRFGRFNPRPNLPIRTRLRRHPWLWLDMLATAIDDRVAMFHQVGGGRNAGLSLPYVFVKAASAAEWKGPAGHIETLNAAAHLARAACKSTDKFHLRRRKSLEIGDRAHDVPRSFEGQQSYAQSAE